MKLITLVALIFFVTACSPPEPGSGGLQAVKENIKAISVSSFISIYFNRFYI